MRFKIWMKRIRYACNREDYDFLLSQIPFGYQNGVTREELVRRTGWKDRVVRGRIKVLRWDLAIINLQDGKGYFRPLEEEYPLVGIWILQENSRARESITTTNSARKWMCRFRSRGLPNPTEVGECQHILSSL